MRPALLAAACAAAFTICALPALAADPAAPVAAPHYGAWGVDLTTRDMKTAPGNDFFGYAQGAWYASAAIPADQGSAGVGYDVYNRAQAQLRSLIEDAAKAPKDGTQAQIGGLYAAFMDEAQVETLDDKPLEPDLAKVAAVSDLAGMTVLMGHSQGQFGTAVFGLNVGPDPRHPEVNILWVGQAGLGLPDRDYYLTDEFKTQRSAYQAYIQRVLTMVGYADPEANAKAVMDFETAIAQVSWAEADRRDVVKTTNPMTLEALQAYAPGLDWNAYLAAAGTPGQTEVILSEKSAVQKIAQIYASTPLPVLKAWEAFHTADEASSVLSKRFVDSAFQLEQALTGVAQQRPRWKRGVSMVDGELGEAIGQEYVALYFPPTSKAQMQALVANLKTAMGQRIQNAAWMSPSTKAEALIKLAKMNVQVGYPDKWRDYSGLKVDPADLYGDAQRSGAFEWAYQLSDLGRAVDHKKWGMTPQTVNAYNGGLENKIVFPAGILQSPYFDPSADPAVNYGSIGAIMGHEITHGFDDQGRKIDDTGALRDWWTPEDAARFEAQAAKYGAQYDTYEGVPGVHINGALTMGENIADLGGLLAALDAYHASLRGQPAPVIDGLSGDQRFFLAFAQSWREKDRDEDLKEQMASDPHSPSIFRVIGPTRNVDAWYDAFHVKPGDKYYLAPQDRARIW